MVALTAILVGYFAFSVYLHRPDRTDPPNPLQPLLTASALGGLESRPSILVSVVRSAVARQRELVRQVAEEVRGKRRNKSRLDVVKKLQAVLELEGDDNAKTVLEILDWAERDS